MCRPPCARSPRSRRLRPRPQCHSGADQCACRNDPHDRSFARGARSDAPSGRASLGAGALTSSPSARRPTRSFGAFRRSSAARSRTVIPPRSSTVPLPCCSTRSRKRSSSRPTSPGSTRLSVPGRIGTSGKPLSPRATSRGRSSVRSGNATGDSAPSYLQRDGDARSARSTTSSLMRDRGRPLSRIFPFAVGGTTDTRPS